MDLHNFWGTLFLILIFIQLYLIQIDLKRLLDKKRDIKGKEELDNKDNEQDLLKVDKNDET